MDRLPERSRAGSSTNARRQSEPENDSEEKNNVTEFDIDEAVDAAAESLVDDVLGIASRDDIRSSSDQSLPSGGKVQIPSAIIRTASRKLDLDRTCYTCNKADEEKALRYCLGCSAVLHEDCWSRWPVHASNHRSGRSQRCKPADYTQCIWVRWLLHTKVSREEQDIRHQDDVWTTWFGVPHYQDPPRPKIHIYPRIQYLLQEDHGASEDSRPVRQYPTLVSFFGETGGGKSTLIRALIRNSSPSTPSDQVPVPGREDDLWKSTSEGVHLYADPQSVYTETPLLYADCEGLRGNALPLASRLSSTAQRSAMSSNVVGATNPGPKRQFQRHTLRDDPDARSRRIWKTFEEHRKTSICQLSLEWGKLQLPSGMYTMEDPSHVHQQTRSLVVKELYPRLLYTFSDVVCYITNNPRATENEIRHLFEWACSGHELTLNQRIRPALIIVVNKDSQTSDENWLNVDFATEKLLGDLELSASFNDLKALWSKRGKSLTTAEDLILCYYDSVRVIFVPTLTEKSAHLIGRQYVQLSTEIREASERQRNKKARVGMRLDVEGFGVYVEHAFHRLAKSLSNSIDFFYLANRNPSSPSVFREHLTALVAALHKPAKYAVSNTVGQEEILIRRILPYLASCIALKANKGDDLQQQWDHIQHYIDQSREAIEAFQKTYWRCEAKDEFGNRCRNTWAGHEKGHQFTPSSKPLTLQIGEFECSFEPGKILSDLYEEIHRVQKLNQPLETLRLAAKACGVTAITSNRTCLTCLANAPMYKLPCRDVQHTICETCAKHFDAQNDSQVSVVTLFTCPLGCKFQASPWKTRVKPAEAGARILALDGGGVRGILTLCILDELLQEVGHKIPIQELFDVAIGTSTGGIIGLGLFKMDWKVKDAIEKFNKLCEKAFQSRHRLQIPLFKNAAQLLCSYRYTNAGIEGALRQAFGESYLFGEAVTEQGERVKTGVVTCRPGSRRPYLLANYSRNSTGDGDYLQREDKPENDFKIWEAARCTSAAPIYFQQYYHERTRKYYTDGAFLRNNPIQVAETERKLIWGRKSPRRPDIVLSVGTGIRTDSQGGAKAVSSKSTILRSMIPSGIRNKVATVHDMVQATLDCERTWQDFLSSKRGDDKYLRVCHRLNVGLYHRPNKIDDVNAVPALEHQARSYLRTNKHKYFNSNYKSAQEHIQVVARRLTASLFYFTEDRRTQVDSDKSDEHVDEEAAVGLGRYSGGNSANTAPNLRKRQSLQPGTVSGHISCRLSPTMTAQFASLLRDEPSFRVRHGKHTQQIRFLDEEAHFDKQTFSAPVSFYEDNDEERSKRDRRIEILFPHKSGKWELISGF